MRKINRLDSTEVQGEGSFVVLKPPPWNEDTKALLLAQERSDDQARGLAIIEKLLPLCVLEWNWTDDDGAPLPKDAEQLSLPEMMWLMPHLTEFLTPAKN